MNRRNQRNTNLIRVKKRSQNTLKYLRQNIEDIQTFYNKLNQESQSDYIYESSRKISINTERKSFKEMKLDLN